MERHSLDWIDGAKSKEEFQKRYDEWASSYDNDLIDKWGYIMPILMGDLFMKHVKNREARILDAGAGTGLGGEHIKRKGYDNLFAIDASQGMLDQAKPKKIYRELAQMFLDERLDFPDDYFDAVLCVGVIGHAPPESFDELIRVTKPSGFIVFSLRVAFYDEPRFHKKQRSLEEMEKWRLVERTDPVQGIPGESANYYYSFVYQVL